MFLCPSIFWVITSSANYVCGRSDCSFEEILSCQSQSSAAKGKTKPLSRKRNEIKRRIEKTLLVWRGLLKPPQLAKTSLTVTPQALWTHNAHINLPVKMRCEQVHPLNVQFRVFFLCLWQHHRILNLVWWNISIGFMNQRKCSSKKRPILLFKVSWSLSFGGIQHNHRTLSAWLASSNSTLACEAVRLCDLVW